MAYDSLKGVANSINTNTSISSTTISSSATASVAAAAAAAQSKADLSTATSPAAPATSGLASIFTSTSKSKRPRTDDTADSAAGSSSNGKVVKLRPDAPAFVPTTLVPKSDDFKFKWLSTNPNSLLHGLYGPPVFSPKLACFDVEYAVAGLLLRRRQHLAEVVFGLPFCSGTLIETRSGGSFPKDSNDWQFWCKKGKVQARLREYHDSGYAIVFVSNQNYAPTHKSHQNFKGKMPLIGKSLADIPFRVLAATAKDVNRKPDVGMFSTLSETFSKQDVAIDKGASFYVGDAAGRRAGHPNKKHRSSKDHSDCDKGWAKNVGIAFYTPEEFFWDRKDESQKEAVAAASAPASSDAISGAKATPRGTPDVATTTIPAH